MSRKNEPRAKVGVADVRLIKGLIAKRDELKEKHFEVLQERREIVQQLQHLTNEEIGKKFDLTRHAVSSIAAGKNWAKVS